MNEQNLEVAKLAAYISGGLKEIDKNQLSRSSKTPQANRIDPRNFLKNNSPIPNHIPNPINVIPETQQTVQINPAQLIDIPEDMKDAVNKYFAEEKGNAVNTNNIAPTQASTSPAPVSEKNNKVYGPDEIRKAFNYIKGKIRKIEKNQEEILQWLKIINAGQSNNFNYSASSDSSDPLGTNQSITKKYNNEN